MVFVCTAPDVGKYAECIGCGGWLYSQCKALDYGVYSHEADPHAPYQGSSSSLRYCSVECMEDWEEVLWKEKQRRQQVRDEEDAYNDGVALACKVLMELFGEVRFDQGDLQVRAG